MKTYTYYWNQFPFINRTKTICYLFLIVTITFSSCKKLVEVDGPNTSVNSDNIYESDVNAASVLTGIYTKLSSSALESGGIVSISLLAGLSSDEFTLNGQTANQLLSAYYTNELGSQKAGFEFWNSIYNNLYLANAALEGVSKSNTLTPAVKQQLLGEARFLRALCLFYLVNLYGDIPLLLTTDYKINSTLARTDQGKVWNQIIVDLEEAVGLLSPSYLDATVFNVSNERLRPNKWVAKALLARAYLYTKKWQLAEQQASDIITNPMFELVSLNDVFKKNNKEAIWQLQPIGLGNNTGEAFAFTILNENDLQNKPSLSPSLLSNFDTGDQRKAIWTNKIEINGTIYFYAYKYTVLPSSDPNAFVSEYSTVFRLAEQYLIRAEARIEQGRIPEGIDDLNVIRERATDKTAVESLQLKLLSRDLSKENALLAVEKERFTELFSEFGHRWLDIKRTGRVEFVMSKDAPRKSVGKIWEGFQQWYPLPIYDLQKNKNLTQNIGY